mmetsp:Transcript_31534/g.100877  ORF Transcript_31534/g.100877 Transcript_31534/m.100877 type:complete len:207 (-) Transcript_31534:211-831(-)
MHRRAAAEAEREGGGEGGAGAGDHVRLPGVHEALRLLLHPPAGPSSPRLQLPDLLEEAGGRAAPVVHQDVPVAQEAPAKRRGRQDHRRLPVWSPWQHPQLPPDAPPRPSPLPGVHLCQSGSSKCQPYLLRIPAAAARKTVCGSSAPGSQDRRRNRRARHRSLSPRPSDHRSLSAGPHQDVDDAALVVSHSCSCYDDDNGTVADADQ